jgi:hypothetical protein
MALISATACLTAMAQGPTTHTIRGEVGAAWDSNPFLTPDEPYYDLNRREWVHPERQPGFFSPVRVTGGLLIPVGRRGHRFVTEYRADGDFYGGETNGSANEAFLKVAPGYVMDLGFGSKRTRTFDIRGFGSFNRDLYFDRDTGLPAESDGLDVSNRFNYLAAGLDFQLDYEVSKPFRFYIEGRAETRDYEDLEDPDVDPYDHDRVRGEVGTVLRLSSKTRVYLSYRFEVRDYDFRQARSLDGESAPDNPLLRYETGTVATTIRWRPIRPWRLEAIYERSERDDVYVHYNDYAQDKLRLRSTVREGGTQWRLTVEYWERDFADAFIFDDPIDPMTGLPNPKKHYETWEFEFEAYFPFKRHMRWLTKIEWVDQTTTDPRFDYDRLRLTGGLELAY